VVPWVKDERMASMFEFNSQLLNQFHAQGTTQSHIIRAAIYASRILAFAAS
jgi:hypothetical protein